MPRRENPLNSRTSDVGTSRRAENVVGRSVSPAEELKVRSREMVRTSFNILLSCVCPREKKLTISSLKDKYRNYTYVRNVSRSTEIRLINIRWTIEQNKKGRISRSYYSKEFIVVCVGGFTYACDEGQGSPLHSWGAIRCKLKKGNERQ